MIDVFAVCSAGLNRHQKKKIYLFLTVGFLFFFPAIMFTVSAEPLRVGASEIKITPPVGSIIGHSYGIGVSEGVDDHLYAKVLVFEKEGVQTAFIACDLISLPHELVLRTRELVEEQTGIPASHIVMTATHAHAGPQMNPSFWNAVGGEPKKKSREYYNNLPSKIVEGILLAQEKLQPARISVGTVQQNTVNFNRRFLMKDGTFQTNPGRLNPDIVRSAGPIDPDVSVVYFESLDSQPIATLVNFALHVAVMGGLHFTADFPGTLSSLLADVKGEDMVTIFTNGTSGNINQNDVSKPGVFNSHEESVRIGTILAGDVLKAYPSLQEIEDHSLGIQSKTVELPVPEVHPDETEWAKDIFERYGSQEDPPLFNDVVKAWRIIDLSDIEGGLQSRHKMTTTVPLIKDGEAIESEVQAITIGDELALVGFPGDAFVELGLSIKENSPFPFTVVSEQSGNGNLSYVPNRKAFSEGGYEVISARFTPGGGELLVDASIRILIDLFPHKWIRDEIDTEH